MNGLINTAPLNGVGFQGAGLVIGNFSATLVALSTDGFAVDASFTTLVPSTSEFAVDSSSTTLVSVGGS